MSGNAPFSLFTFLLSSQFYWHIMTLAYSLLFDPSCSCFRLWQNAFLAWDVPVRDTISDWRGCCRAYATGRQLTSQSYLVRVTAVAAHFRCACALWRTPALLPVRADGPRDALFRCHQIIVSVPRWSQEAQALQIVARPPNLAVLSTHCGQLIIR